MPRLPIPSPENRLLILASVIIVIAGCGSLAASRAAQLQAPQVQSPQVQSPTPAPSATATPSPTPSANDWNTTIDSSQKVITALALIIGGIWAWLKFFRGRTFRSRIELAVSAEIIISGTSKFLKATMQMKNVGLSQVILRTDVTFLDVFLIDVASVRPADDVYSASWGEPRATFNVFQDHGWVEPGEEISDELLVQLPDTEQLACKLKLTVNSRRNFLKTEGTGWSAIAIIDPRPVPPADESTTPEKGKKS